MALGFDQDEIRRASCRALNRMYRDLFDGFEDRMLPVGVIPMQTPQEAIAELDFVVRELKMRAVVMATYVVRPIVEAARKYPEMARFATWADTFGIDSQYDYDSVWAKCLELKIAATFHSPAQGFGFRKSVSNHMYNSLGNFAAASEACCKALLLGGVTRRFPQLKFAFLECGVGWARSLLSDAIRFWEKRNRAGMENYNPANLDRAELNRLFKLYGEKVVGGRSVPPRAQFVGAVAGTAENADAIDEWALSGIRTKEEFAEIFTGNFYIGCEADDPVTASAFDAARNPLHLRFNAILGSDIGHWDVPDMSRVLEETYEPVEKGLFSEQDLLDFVFTNPVRLWTAQNPDFFKGTVVENQAAQAIHD
jgi:predicted TIM-barrel fold metal-dependent hydrolase